MNHHCILCVKITLYSSRYVNCYGGLDGLKKFLTYSFYWHMHKMYAWLTAAKFCAIYSSINSASTQPSMPFADALFWLQLSNMNLRECIYCTYIWLHFMNKLETAKWHSTGKSLQTGDERIFLRTNYHITSTTEYLYVHWLIMNG